eukprot:CAMPEP_0197528432 /NCGR_PEP_ID=MMETSP1318-20131121/25087_1 /TAXON_ID=552666 /ORGANISM="Partenskyella glossopodia, Strain RCC365" /LENGTH=41 /DNA_ID= /DNA_START= /DNA_END= /DNA_ORIENTATION=
MPPTGLLGIAICGADKAGPGQMGLGTAEPEPDAEPEPVMSW